ncbi:hypothetical protein KKA23_01880 [Patescibacteria group bacterium]|nr:hypothetical protein [Patescibacteria group bacterium]
MKNSLMVILASAFGGLIGTLTASQLGIFWWIGMIVGFLTGFLSFKFGDVLRAIKYAWKKVIGWKPNWPLSRQIFLYFLSMCLWLIFVVSPLLFLSDSETSTSLLLTIGMICMIALIIVPVIFLFLKIEADETFINSIKRIWKYSVLFVLLYHLPRLIFKKMTYVIPLIPKFISDTLHSILDIIITIGKFIKTVFIMIYSELRILCGMCGAAGTVIGHLYYDNAIVGMFAGGAFGALNYLLVSKGIFRKQVKAYQEAKTT